jgi:hypothetical protein
LAEWKNWRANAFDDDGLCRVRTIGIGEQSTSQHENLQCVEISGRHINLVGGDLLACLLALAEVTPSIMARS